jgi:hypothetical protein
LGRLPENRRARTINGLPLIGVLAIDEIAARESRVVSQSASNFERFLLERLHLDPEEHLSFSDWAGTGNTIGALALRLGVLSLNEIDRILDAQESDRRLFGEIAVEHGYLTSDQVERLIGLQQFHQLLEVGEHMVLKGYLSIEELQTALLEYYRANQSVPAPLNALATA